MSTTAAVVVAAGAGERLGHDLPKALVALSGAPLIVHALRGLLRSGRVDEAVVVAPDSHLDTMRSALRQGGINAAAVCTGGASRRDSVGCGLAACGPEVDVVVVHDAARPLVSPDLVRRTVDALVEPWSAVAPGMPVVDTLKLVDSGRERVLRTLDRRGVWTVQTPQVFPRHALQQAHERIEGVTVTDDLALVEAAGGRVRLILGERRNFKITYPEDLIVAEAFLAANSGGPG